MRSKISTTKVSGYYRSHDALISLRSLTTPPRLSARFAKKSHSPKDHGDKSLICSPKIRKRNGSREASVSFSLLSRAPPLSPRAQSRHLPVISTNVERSLHALRLVEMTSPKSGSSKVRISEHTKIKSSTYIWGFWPCDMSYLRIVEGKFARFNSGNSTSRKVIILFRHYRLP